MSFQVIMIELFPIWTSVIWITNCELVIWSRSSTLQGISFELIWLVNSLFDLFWVIDFSFTFKVPFLEIGPLWWIMYQFKFSFGLFLKFSLGRLQILIWHWILTSFRSQWVFNCLQKRFTITSSFQVSQILKSITFVSSLKVSQFPIFFTMSTSPKIFQFPKSLKCPSFEFSSSQISKFSHSQDSVLKCTSSEVLELKASSIHSKVTR